MASTISQTGPYIPRTDDGARAWLNNFAMIAARDPAAVGLAQADATVLSALAAQYDAAFAVATEPTTRTSGAIAEKDAIRNQAIATFRVYAQQIKKNLGVSDAQKLELGLHLDDGTRTRISAPVTIPILWIVNAIAGVHTLRYADSATPAARRKPRGASHLLLFVAIEDEQVGVPMNLELVGAFTKQPFEVEFPHEHAGKVATYFGKWVTARGLEGPWSAPVSMMIPFAGMAPSRDGAKDNTAARAVPLNGRSGPGGSASSSSSVERA